MEKGDVSSNAESGFAENRSCSAGLMPQAVDYGRVHGIFVAVGGESWCAQMKSFK